MGGSPQGFPLAPQMALGMKGISSEARASSDGPAWLQLPLAGPGPWPLAPGERAGLAACSCSYSESPHCPLPGLSTLPLAQSTPCTHLPEEAMCLRLGPDHPLRSPCSQA